MNQSFAPRVAGSRKRRLALVTGLLALALLVTTLIAYAGTPLSIAGYLDFSYGEDEDLLEPTYKGNQSKLWWNDGWWWGVLYSPSAGAFTIHRLDRTTQDWIDTQTLVDEREVSRADALWDGVAQKLYILSHYKRLLPDQEPNTPENWPIVLRYSYDATADTYALDSGYPTYPNESRARAMVIDKDSVGRLWVGYVSRELLADVFQVYVNYSLDDGLTWGDPYILPFPENLVRDDDVSSLIAFQDAAGPKVGVLWSDQLDGNFYFAVHPDSEAPTAGWAIEPGFTTVADSYPSDDHMDFAETNSGQLLAVVKTGTTTLGEPLIAVVARDSDGSYSAHRVSEGNSQDTRPIIVYDESDNSIWVFVSSKTEGSPDGSMVCYQNVVLPTPLSSLTFPYDNCPPPGGEVLAELKMLQPMPPFIGDASLDIQNPTSTKQTVNDESSVAVLAVDDVNGHYYVHNVSGDAPPPPPGGDNWLYLPVILKP
jgi:hypothetical protein